MINTNNVLLIYGELYEDFMFDFVEDFNKLDLTKPITIYINSPGGYTASSKIVIDLINKHKHLITLIAVDRIYSAAFDIFFLSQCKRTIIEFTTGMAHFSWCTLDVSETGKAKTDSDKFALQQLKNSKAKTIETFKQIGLNETELRLIRNNKDCYLTTARLQQILDGQIKDN